MTNHGALFGLRVLDLAGPIGVYGTRLFAGLGADVLRVEPPAGDPLRWRPPFFQDLPGPDRSLHHWHFNAGKRAVVLDLSTGAGRTTLLGLVQNADVFVETLRPGERERLGVDYARLRQANPRLVLASVTPFGLTGPRAGCLGGDLVGSASSGVMAVCGFAESAPFQPGGEHALHQAGLAAAAGILVALWDRNRTGRGGQVEVSMQESLAIAPEAALGTADVEQRLRPRRGLGTMSNSRILFETSDGWAGGVLGSRWIERISWLESAGLLSPEDAAAWRDEQLRAKRGTAELDRLTELLFSSLPKEEVYLQSQAHRMAIAPVRSIAELFNDRQLAARDYWQPLPTPIPGLVPLDSGAPFQLSQTPWHIDRPAPRWEEVPGGAEATKEPITWTESTGYSAEQVGHENAEKPESVEPLEGPSRLSGALPLANLRILDFTVQGAGPVATRLLANFGAEVIKIESSARPDGARLLDHPRPPGSSSPNTGAIFNNFNADKLGMAVNLETEAGREIAEGLVRISDVVIDNFGRDPLGRWGLSVDELTSIRPDLIILRSSAVGRYGPDREFIGFGFGIAAAAGLNGLTGFPRQPPVGAGPLPDFTCNPHHAVVALLAALEYRRRTGEGQVIDLSQMESTISFLGTAILDWQVNGRDGTPSQNRSAEMAPHGAYQCGGDDRWIAIAVGDESWPRFCQAAGHQDWQDDPRFRTLADRKANEDQLDREVSGWTSDKEPFALAALLQANGVASAPVESNLDILFRDEHLAARGYHRWLDHPEAGRRAHDGTPFRLEGVDAGPKRPSPCLGEHTDLVLVETLGYAEDRVANLYVTGAVG